MLARREPGVGGRALPVKIDMLVVHRRLARVVAVRGGQSFVGWVATAFLSGVDVPPPPPPAANVRVTAPAGLRLRAGPGLGFAIRRIVPFGTHLRTTGVRQAADGFVWAQIVIDGLTVWAADAFLAPL